MRLYLKTKTRTQLEEKPGIPRGGLKRDRQRRGRDTGRECLQGGQKSERRQGQLCQTCGPLTVPLISGTEILGTSLVESEGF